MKHVFKLDDGRIEPIQDLMKSDKEFALRRILVDEKMGGAEHVTFGYARFDPRTSYHKKHAHPHAEEVFYVIAGKGIGGVDSEEKELVKGDTVWVPRAAVHWLYNPFDEPCEIIFLYTAPSLAAAGYEIVE
ncbi:MAG: cupin domain-containing protein [Acidobacteria bacterium]|nr:cupin domain-containing protein [Acidobacteriota bacterium]